MSGPVQVPGDVQAQAATIIREGLIQGGLTPEEATEMAAEMVSHCVDQMAQGNLPGLPGFDYGDGTNDDSG